MQRRRAQGNVKVILLCEGSLQSMGVLEHGGYSGRALCKRMSLRRSSMRVNLRRVARHHDCEHQQLLSEHIASLTVAVAGMHLFCGLRSWGKVFARQEQRRDSLPEDRCRQDINALNCPCRFVAAQGS